MADGISYVGLDVHKDGIVVAIADSGLRGEVRGYGRIANTAAALERLVRKLGGNGTTLRFCYEAGPCGYGIQRQLSGHRHECVVEDYIQTVEAAATRRDRLTAQIEAMLPDWTLAPVVAALQTMRGMALVNAATLVAELGDLSRFANPRQLMAYLGLVPSEHSSGASVRRGGITKAGSSAARRLLIEAAWCYRFPARVSRDLRLRQEDQPKLIREIAWKGQVRLCARYRRLARTGKPANVVTTAIARELVGFVWAIARQITIPAG